MTDTLVDTAPSPSVPSPRRGGRFTTAAAAVILPLLAFVVLQPETFGVTPNAIDPFFYAGLGVNFDDASKLGGSWYFITRWSAWYPLYLGDLVAGPFVGRLLLRLVAVAAILAGLWRLRPTWSWEQRVLGGIVMITMPMFVRPLMTDYVEYAVLLYGSGLVLLALAERPGIAHGVGAGVLTALLIVANPLALTVAVPPLFVIVVVQTKGLVRKAGMSLVIGVALGIVLVAGLFYFRWVHGIPNLYQPTIEFLRNPPGVDPLKSPRLEWLGRFTWLWVPPFLVAVAAATAVRLGRPLDRLEWTALGMAVAQYLLQWFDQFVRNGDGLEISYYWSFTFATLGIALALVVMRLAADIGRLPVAAIVVGWTALLALGVPDQLRLPAGFRFAVVAVIVVAAIAALWRRFPLPAVVLFLGFVLWTQIGAPTYDPSAYHDFNVSPRYDRLFGSDGDAAEAGYAEAVWFADELDRLGNDDQAVFLPLGPWGSPITGIFDASVGGHMLRPDPVTGALDPIQRFSLLDGEYPWLVIIGDPDHVASQMQDMSELGLDPPTIDETHDADLGYRLVAIPLHESLPLPMTFEAADLPVLGGVIQGDDVVAAAGDDPGFVTYGPYVNLPPGRYALTVYYTASAPVGETIGGLDVSSAGGAAIARTVLPGTAGAPSSVSLGFQVTDDSAKWEFRTQSDGLADLVVDRIELRQS